MMSEKRAMEVHSDDVLYRDMGSAILGDPGADNGDEGKSKRAEKYGTKKSKERREEPLGTMPYQTSSKQSPPFWLLIGARKLLCFSRVFNISTWNMGRSFKNFIKVTKEI